MARITARASKDLQQLPDPLQQKARDVIARLDSEPALGKKLLGKLEGLRSVRVGRSWRILYRVDETGVIVMSIRLRRDSYR